MMNYIQHTLYHAVHINDVGYTVVVVVALSCTVYYILVAHNHC